MKIHPLGESLIGCFFRRIDESSVTRRSRLQLPRVPDYVLWLSSVSRECYELTTHSDLVSVVLALTRSHTGR